MAAVVRVEIDGVPARVELDRVLARIDAYRAGHARRRRADLRDRDRIRARVLDDDVLERRRRRVHDLLAEHGRAEHDRGYHEQERRYQGLAHAFSSFGFTSQHDPARGSEKDLKTLRNRLRVAVVECTGELRSRRDAELSVGAL